jgi:hypothetical protein
METEPHVDWQLAVEELGVGSKLLRRLNMEARIIIPTADGERLSYDLRLHESGSRDELRIVLNTSEETFESWLYFLMRDLGAHVVTDEPERLRTALGLSSSDQGVVNVRDVADVDVTRHVVKT